jgi:hypothetical protein
LNIVSNSTIEDDEDDDGMDEEDYFIEQGMWKTTSVLAKLTSNLGDGGHIHRGETFGWDGDVDPPMIISHRGHHRPRGFPDPFTYPGGPRDVLGGMSLFLPVIELDILRAGLLAMQSILQTLTEAIKLIQ